MTFTVRMVRELKGAPISCYMLIMGAGKPVTNAWLERFSGYSDKPVSKAMALLSCPEYNLVCREDFGWVPVGETLMIFGVSDEAENAKEDTDAPNSRRNSDPITIINKDSKDLNKESNNRGRKISDYTDTNAPIWKELAKGSIFKNTRTATLVKKDYITVEYVRAHREALKKQGRGGANWAGLLIRILEDETPIPVSVEAKTEDRSRYVGGEYADFID
jgi:hypothetical protein